MAVGGLGLPGRARTAHEYAHEALRTAILNGTLSSGARLIQNDLAVELGVSTTPVREALRDLATEGLVVFDPNRGALVRRLDVAEVEEVYELRMALEPIMVRRVIEKVTDEQLARADALRLQMEASADMADWADLNRRYHAVFNEVEAGSRLATILGSLRDTATPYVRLSLGARPQQVPQANSEHTELLRLFRARDVEAAVELTLQHLRATLTAILETQRPVDVDGSPGPAAG
jgi:DNA-binding GntR family transcriptional regulator